MIHCFLCHYVMLKLLRMSQKEIGNVQYNIDNAIDKLGNGIVSKGISHQQFSVASANKLADFLSEILHNMQMDLSGMSSGNPKPGQGKGYAAS